MIDSPLSDLKLTKSTLPAGFLRTNSIQTQSTKFDTSASPGGLTGKGWSTPPFSPKNYGFEGDDSVRSNTKISFFAGTTMKSPSKMVELDDHILTNIDRLVDKKVKAPKSNKEEEEARKGKKSSSLSRSEVKREGIVANINHYIKEKGLMKQRKDRDFNSRLEIFNKVQTFVDARQLVQDIAIDNKSKPGQSTPKSTMETIFAPKRPTPFIQGGFPKTPILKSPQKNFQHRSRKAKVIIDTDVSEKDELETLDSPKSPAFLRLRNSSQEDSKTMKIRKLYLDLKKDAISKFGSEIFDNIQDKLQDPKCLKWLENKHKNELLALRSTKAEFGEMFETGEDLVEYLYRNEKKKNPASEEESSNKFQHYLNKELIENSYSQLHYQRSSSMPKINFQEADLTSPTIGPKHGQIEEDLSWNDAENEPQIKMFHEIEDYRRKSTQVIRLLKQRLIQASKEPTFDKNDAKSVASSRPESREISKLGFSPLLTPTISRQESLLVITPTKLVPTKPVSKEKMWTLNTPKNTTKKNMANTFYDSSPLASLTPKKIGNISKGFLGESQILEKKGKRDTRSISQDMLKDLCYQLDDFENSNKELNKEMKLSMMKMEDTYSKHFNVLTRFGVPESLLNPKPQDFFKSTSRLAINLASQNLKKSNLQSY